MDVSNLQASTDITIFTSHSVSVEINDDGDISTTTKDGVTHAPVLWVFFVGFLTLYLFGFIYWQVQHRLEKKKK